MIADSFLVLHSLLLTRRCSPIQRGVHLLLYLRLPRFGDIFCPVDSALVRHHFRTIVTKAQDLEGVARQLVAEGDDCPGGPRISRV